MCSNSSAVQSEKKTTLKCNFLKNTVLELRQFCKLATRCDLNPCPQQPETYISFEVTAVFQRKTGVTPLCHRIYMLKRACLHVRMLN